MERRRKKNEEERRRGGQVYNKINKSWGILDSKNSPDALWYKRLRSGQVPTYPGRGRTGKARSRPCYDKLPSSPRPLVPSDVNLYLLCTPSSVHYIQKDNRATDNRHRNNSHLCTQCAQQAHSPSLWQGKKYATWTRRRHGAAC